MKNEYVYIKDGVSNKAPVSCFFTRYRGFVVKRASAQMLFYP